MEMRYMLLRHRAARENHAALAAVIGLCFLATRASAGTDATSGEAAASGALISCPSSIETSQHLAHGLPGWTERQLGGTSHLIYMEVYRGRPEQEDVVLSSRSELKRGVQTDIWILPQAAKADGLWLLCAYQNTRVTLSARIPDKASECQGISRKDARATDVNKAYCH
jgi:hypothetical protein